MTQLYKILVAAVSAAFFMASAHAQNAGTVTNHAFAIGKGAGTTGYSSLLCGSAQLAVGQSAADPICKTITGDWALSAAGAATLATVNSNVGSFGSATQAVALTVNAKGLITAASASTITPAIGSVTGLGTGCSTFLATPSSANLRACLTDEVGTGTAYFVGGALGTPASATLTNAVGLPLSGLTNQAAYTVVANATGSAAAPTAVSIPALTQKASPVANDKIMIADSAASDALKYATISSIATAGSVSSIAGNTGAFTLGGGVTNSTNQIRLAMDSAVLNANPSDPTGTNSTTGVFMGLGVTTCRLAPTYSTRMRFTIQGKIFNNTSGSGAVFHLRYGTGGGPANGTAVGGTGAALTATVNSAGTGPGVFPFTADGIATGLTPATTYWFDIVLSASANTASISSVTCVAQEVM